MPSWNRIRPRPRHAAHHVDLRRPREVHRVAGLQRDVLLGVPRLQLEQADAEDLGRRARTNGKPGMPCGRSRRRRARASLGACRLPPRPSSVSGPPPRCGLSGDRAGPVAPPALGQRAAAPRSPRAPRSARAAPMSPSSTSSVRSAFSGYCPGRCTSPVTNTLWLPYSATDTVTCGRFRMPSASSVVSFRSSSSVVCSAALIFPRIGKFTMPSGSTVKVPVISAWPIDDDLQHVAGADLVVPAAGVPCAKAGGSGPEERPRRPTSQRAATSPHRRHCGDGPAGRSIPRDSTGTSAAAGCTAA